MQTEPGTVGRVIAVLERLAHSHKPMRLTEIARGLQLPVSSTHVLLRSLTSLGYVEVNTDDRTYSVGPRMVRLSIGIVSRLEVVDVGRPLVTDLAMRLGEDVYLAVAERDAISYAYKADGEQSLRLDIQLGIERPLHATSVGKLYLAMQNDNDLERLLGTLNLYAFTSSTAVELRTLRKQIEEIRSLGYAVSDQEMVEGIVASAAPIFDDRGRMIGAVSAPVLRTKFKERGGELVEALSETAAQISERLGWVSSEMPASR